jgi:hypothetical protein
VRGGAPLGAGAGPWGFPGSASPLTDMNNDVSSRRRLNLIATMISETSERVSSLNRFVTVRNDGSLTMDVN